MRERFTRAFYMADPEVFTLFRGPRRVDNSRVGVQDAAPMRHNGRVKWFNASRGFGCIALDGGGEVPVHTAAIRSEGVRTLEEGQAVECDVAQGPHGPQAERVVPTGEVPE
jgi:CspA family cold shock protein